MIYKAIILVSFALIGSTQFAFGQTDSIKTDDTITVPQDQIQSVKLKCTSIDQGVGRKKVINSQAEFDTSFNNVCQSIYHIDFSTSTVLFFPTSAGGCKIEYVRTVKIIGTKVIYSVHIIEYGPCMVAAYNKNCIVIPKLNSDSQVEFQVTREERPGKEQYGQ